MVQKRKRKRKRKEKEKEKEKESICLAKTSRVDGATIFKITNMYLFGQKKQSRWRNFLHYLFGQKHQNRWRNYLCCAIFSVFWAKMPRGLLQFSRPKPGLGQKKIVWPEISVKIRLKKGPYLYN